MDKPTTTRPEWMTWALLLAVAVLAVMQWHTSGRVGELLTRLDAVVAREAQQVTGLAPLVPSSISNTASGNTVTVNTDSALPQSPRTVEQVAAYLGVTPDTVRESYIPAWIENGQMSEADRVKNRWIIPETFVPYRPR